MLGRGTAGLFHEYEQRFVDLYPSAGLPDNDFAPNHMPAVAWSSSDELNQYSDVRAMHASGAINVTRPANWTRELRRHYSGAVSYLDHNVGRVLTALKENKQEEDAIVCVLPLPIVLWRAAAWNLPVAKEIY